MNPRYGQNTFIALFSSRLYIKVADPEQLLNKFYILYHAKLRHVSCNSEV